jgi:ribosomal protein L15E
MVNVILVPALLLLIGVVVYKKVVEPRRGGSQAAKPEKTAKAQKIKPQKIKEQKGKKAKAESGSTPRQMSSSGRMGSVL